MSDKILYQVDNEIAVLSLDNAPVHALSQALRSAIQNAFRKAIADPGVKAILITSTGPLFSAGADISEFSAPDQDGPHMQPTLPALLAEIEKSTKLVVAGLCGSALGGGLELALVCHYRFVHKNAKLGLPEVLLGILPGAGGTQRLPRLVGPKAALDMIVSGKAIKAGQGAEIGLVDHLFDGDEDFQAAALDYISSLLGTGAPMNNALNKSVDMDGVEAGLFDDYRKSIARRAKGLIAPFKCIDAVEAATKMSLEDGLAQESAFFQDCNDSPQAKGQQHIFFAERNAGKVAGIDKNTPLRRIKSVAIIGSGTMGGGIAMNFIGAGIPVILLDMSQENLDRGLGVIRKNYDVSVSRGRFSQQQVDHFMSLITGTLSYDDLSDVDLVIEAVFESMEVKKSVFGELDRVCKPGAILASNTSTLDVDEIANITGRPEDVIGLHFFSPANVMKLLEIVRAEKTAPDVVATCLKMAKSIRKVGVVVGVCFGFVGNRMLEPYIRESARLLLEGATPEQVDKVMTDWGMAMGPFQMSDLAGVDVGYLVRESRRQYLAHDESYCLVGDKLAKMGYHGQKSGKGYYLYEGRNRTVNEEVLSIIKETAAELGIKQREISDAEIFERCMYTLINEGADILQEGIAGKASDIDAIWCFGYGFPAYRGGPMFFADQIGLDKIHQSLCHYREETGQHGDWWIKPSALLEKLMDEGLKFSDL